MSTLVEIEAAVDRLPLPEQKELYAFLGMRLETGTNRGLSPEQIAEWLKTARGAGLPGVSTEEIMALTRGEQ